MNGFTFFNILNAIKSGAAYAVFAWLSVGFAQEKLPSDLPKHPQTVATLDTNRYMGVWYEIARFPNVFQKQCVGKVLATYRLLDTGAIEVANQCDTGQAKPDVSVGMAKLGPAGLNTQLRVSFLPKLLRWLPIGWGDYWVIDLASDYRYAVVSDSNRNYLWLLSRNTSLSAADRQGIEERLKTQGFDISKLVNTAQ